MKLVHSLPQKETEVETEDAITEDAITEEDPNEADESSSSSSDEDGVPDNQGIGRNLRLRPNPNVPNRYGSYVTHAITIVQNMLLFESIAFGK